MAAPGSGHGEASSPWTAPQARRPRVAPLQPRHHSSRSASDATHISSPSADSLPHSPSYSAAPITTPGAGTAPASPLTNSPTVRAPNPAKRVPRNPADELQSAVTRDVLRSEAKRAAKQNSGSNIQQLTGGVLRNVSAPTPTAGLPQITPPTSPIMLSSTSPPSAAAAGRADPRSIMPRNPSIDSTVSTNSTTSAKLNGVANYRVSESSRPEDVPSLIAEAGSPEAAILKLIHEKNQAASHNAQLWKLVEKQRTMILGLNKDLEKALKDKEKYRKKVKDHLAHSQSTLANANLQLEEIAKRAESPSSMVVDTAIQSVGASARELSIESHKVSDAADGPFPAPGRSDTPLDASNAPSSNLPATPQSTGSANQIMRDIELAEAAAVSAQENRVITQSPTKSPTLTHATGSPQLGTLPHRRTNSISSATASPTTAGSFSSTKNQMSRKAPPAPLKLSSPTAAEAAAKVTNNIVDPSDSEYEDDPDSARGEQGMRGRRKTREEDDREREAAAKQEFEHRSVSKKAKKSKSATATERSEGPSETTTRAPSDSNVREVAEVPVITRQMPQTSDAAAVIRQQALASTLSKGGTAAALMSPGLPMSPRPGDRPMNSPMPRPPNKLLNTIPMSPKAGVIGLPLSPRAPRQPIPMPPQTSLSITSPHLARAEGYQLAQPQTSSLAKEIKSSPQGSPEHEQPFQSSGGGPMTPGEIYQGLVTDEYPDLLLPPNALPSIYIKTASSRMKPSRQSYLAPKTADDNPVFTLAVFERSDKRQLWRVEKTFVALAQLDEEIKASCRFRERLPDKTLFNGHAPARMDARRSAIDVYFHRMLESITDDRSAMVVCKFLSTDAIGSDGGDYFGGSVDLRSDTPLSKRPRREGYLTKRGKNFGGWKARYFVLDGPVLKYYDNLGGAQLGSIKLHNAQIGKQSTAAQTPQEDEDHQFRHAFLILEPKKKDTASLVRHVLCAESDEERDGWVEALMQYVDYKDEPDEMAARAMQIAMADISAPRSPRLQKSLTELRPASRSRDVVDSKPDQLRAVGYSDTVAGEAPIMVTGPPSPRLGDLQSPPHDGNFGPAIASMGQAHPNISGPTNAQLISNAGEWGMKPPPTPQGKDKKRSLFSGLRGRSSSDLGPNDKPLGGGQDQNGARAVRAVFGAPLADAAEFARPADIVTGLPAVVYRCIEYLLAHNAPAEEGIFRLSGSNTVIKALRDRFNAEGDINLVAEGAYLDIHAVASLLKLYLRELPSSILTRDLHLEFLSCQEKQGREKIVALNELVNRLPRANRTLLEALSSFLLSIVSNAEVNKMNIRNVGIVFAPTLNVPAPLISSFVEDQAAIFGPALATSEPPASFQTVSTSAALPTDLRSPRKQLFSDLPTPAYNQTHFQSLGALHPDDNTGMIPVHPTYAAYQLAPQGEGGFGSLNDALQSPAAIYNVAASGIPSSRGPGGAGADASKARRRESAMYGFPLAAGTTPMQKKASMNQLREENVQP